MLAAGLMAVAGMGMAQSAGRPAHPSLPIVGIGVVTTVAFVAVASTSPNGDPRYTLPLLPFLAVGLGWCLHHIDDWRGARASLNASTHLHF